MQIAQTSSAGIPAAMVVAFGIQQLIETLDTILTGLNLIGSAATEVSRKKLILKLCSIAAAAAAVGFLGIDVLAGQDVPLHGFITVMALAGGTEGVNSVLKYAGYAKENKKLDAATKLDGESIGKNLTVIENK